MLTAPSSHVFTFYCIQDFLKSHQFYRPNFTCPAILLCIYRSSMCILPSFPSFCHIHVPLISDALSIPWMLVAVLLIRRYNVFTFTYMHVKTLQRPCIYMHACKDVITTLYLHASSYLPERQPSVLTYPSSQPSNKPFQASSMHPGKDMPLGTLRLFCTLFDMLLT